MLIFKKVPSKAGYLSKIGDIFPYCQNANRPNGIIGPKLTIRFMDLKENLSLYYLSRGAVQWSCVDDARPLARLEAMILRFAASRQGNYTVRYKCARKLCGTVVIEVQFIHYQIDSLFHLLCWTMMNDFCKFCMLSRNFQCRLFWVRGFKSRNI